MDPRLVALAARQNGVFTRRQALEAGHPPDDVRHRIAAGRWLAVRRGVYVEATVATEARRTAEGAHVLAAAAALVAIGGDPVISHRSAAIAWSLPLLGGPPADVAVTVERQHRRRAPALELHTARTPPHHRATASGLAVTTVARTIADVARSQPFRDAVVMADAALRERRCDRDDIVRVIDDCRVWRGIARTKRVLAFADGRAESPGESISRVAIVAAGLPAPVSQSVVIAEGRRYRVDFAWPAHRLVGEFDGRVKYGSGSDLWEEKAREDAIRRTGLRVVRWIWADVYPDPSRMIGRVGRALADTP